MNRKYLRATGLAILAGLSALAFRPREEQATALFAGGCFWSMQKAFDEVPGVVRTTVGFAGGTTAKQVSYQEVSGGGTGYAETVKVEYDPRRIGYDSLLQVYWHHIDPLTVNQAFCDRGPQYRSIIFYGDAAQKRLAEASKTALDRSGRFKTPVVTAIEPVTPFQPAEAYHQEFYKKYPDRYERYRIGCRRDQRLAELWGKTTTAQANTDKGWDPMTFTKPDKKELKQKLSPEQFAVTQEDATERPFHNQYWDNHEAGIYVDVVSGEPLFSSQDKFDSGTGWPSFTRPLEPKNVTTKTDRSLFMERTEVRSAHANSHLGHLFDDGPKPTGQRYCMNSASLRFIPVDKLEAEGYGEYLKLFK
jgi:peptide methionine sulfoxide reductase msrA/msrB